MPIDRIAAAPYSGGGNTTDLTVALPAGVVTGDLLTFALFVGPGNPDVTQVPAGWTLVGQQRSLYASTYVYTRAAASEPASRYWRVAAATPLSGALLVYRGATSVHAVAIGQNSWSGGQVVAYNIGGLSPRKATDREVVLAAVGAAASVQSSPTISVPLAAGQSAFHAAVLNSGSGTSNLTGAAHDRTVNVLGGTQVATVTQQTSSDGSASGVRLVLTDNRPPNTPLVSWPASFDRTRDLVVNVGFRDPDPGDAAGASELRHRPTGVTPVPAWTVVKRVSPNTAVTIPADTVVAGQNEVQGRSTDASGAVGEWSASQFTTAVVPPPGHTFVTPAAGATITGPSQRFTLSNPGTYQATEWRVLADLNGAPDESNVLVPWTLISSGDLLSFTATGLPNSTSIHAHARALNAGVAGPTATSSHPVSYTPPAAPLASVTVLPLALQVQSANPTPTGGQPQVLWNEVERGLVEADGSVVAEGFLRDFSRAGRVRLQLLPNGSTQDYVVAVGVDHGYRLHAVGDNGTRTAGPWVAGPVDLTAVVVDEGAYADAAYDPTSYD